MKNALTKKDHPLSYSCFSKCTEWKLNSTIVANKETYGIILNAKAYFFKKLGMSMLNYLHIKDNKIETTQQRQNEIKNLFDDKDQKDDYELPHVKLPIDNSENNFLLIESNLGKEENLYNIIFIEFDFKNSLINKEKLKHFIEVNNDFVEKEMFFVLNATIHGKPLFEKELKFSVETRKFIKSIQFKVENYKTEYISRKTKEKVKNTFFTRIISNQNIGIEFSKQNFDNIESYHTNFNTIVNSNFYIHKIFLELNIPNKILKIPFKSDEIKNKEIADFYHNYKPYKESEFYDKSISNFHNKNRYSFPIHKSKNYLNKEHFQAPFFPHSDNSRNGNIYKIPMNEMGQKQRFDVGVNPMLYNNFLLQQQFIYANYNLQQNIYRMTEKKKNNSLTPKHINTINLIQYHEGSCNFTLFLKAIKPFLLRIERESYKRINLMSFFNNYEIVSILGLDVMYFLENSVANVNYSATLSSMEIIINDPYSVERILNYLMQEETKRLENLISNNESFEFEEDDNYKVTYISKENTIKIEFFESKPFYSRPILIEGFEYLFKKFPVLKEINLSNLTENSWFSVLWTPLKSTNPKLSGTSFLIYYQFSISDAIQKAPANSVYEEIPIIGILPIKMDENIWFAKISQINCKNSSNLDGYNYLNYENERENKQIMLISIENVFKFILNQTKKCSFDYNIYLKGQIN